MNKTNEIDGPLPEVKTEETSTFNQGLEIKKLELNVNNKSNNRFYIETNYDEEYNLLNIILQISNNKNLNKNTFENIMKILLRKNNSLKYINTLILVEFFV